MALYVVEILGTNASTARASSGEVELVANPHPFTGLVRWADGSAALFESKDQANDVGLACRWNNQRYLVKAARGNTRTGGRVVPVELHEWLGCQESQR